MNGAESKVYICLFMCTTTIAVHLEIVTDLTAETFLLTLRRFVSQSHCHKLLLLSVAEELKKLLSSKHLMESLSREGVEWKIMPKCAPWYGGWWERLKTLGRAHVSLIVLETLVAKIEPVLNDLPLTYTPSEFDEMDLLTPAHFTVW